MTQSKGEPVEDTYDSSKISKEISRAKGSPSFTKTYE